MTVTELAPARPIIGQKHLYIDQYFDPLTSGQARALQPAMSFWQDVHFGARTLRKSPGFTLTAVVTLALGIGVTTAIYSVTDAMLWKPVPIPRLDRLAVTLQRIPEDPNAWNAITAADFEDIRQNSTAFDSLAGWQ